MAQPAGRITTAYEDKLATDAQLEEEMDQIKIRRKELLKELGMLDKKERMIDEQRDEIALIHIKDIDEDFDINAINKLVNACSVQYSDIRMPGDTSFHMSEKIISTLKNCQEQDTDLINAILFIFRLSGVHIDIDQIEHLNYKDEMDREVINELLILMNDKIDEAIKIIKSNYLVWRKSDIKERVMAIKKAQKDFKPIREEYYEKYVKPARKELSKYYGIPMDELKIPISADKSGQVIDIDYEVDDKKEAA